MILLSFSVLPALAVFTYEVGLLTLLMIVFLVLLGVLGPGYYVSSLMIKVDMFSSGLTYMSLVCFFGVFMSLSESLKFSITGFYSFLIFSSVMMISSFNMILMYLWFEVSLIPIFLLLIYEGYQPERLNASVYMVVYTLLASLPLLSVLLFFVVSFFLTGFDSSLFNFKGSKIFTQELLIMVWLLAFLVKFPIYGLHYWLPLAHVQAPTGGSMVLAAVLLKLGGVGVFKIIPLIGVSGMFIYLVCSWTLLGGALSSLLCMISQEMKVLVALSSVAHMSLAILVICTGLSASPLIYFLILVAHGYSSSAMFLFVGLVYLQVGSRSMMVLFNMGNSLPSIWFWGLLAILANMGVPPTLNFIAEIGVAMLVANLDLSFAIFSAFLMFLSVMFSVMLFSQVFMGADFRVKAVSSLSGVNFFISSALFIYSVNYFVSAILYLNM